MLVRVLLIAVAGFGVQYALTGAAAADPPAGDWSRLRMCESSGRYDIVASHGGYYGAYQFDLPTWRSVGGKGYPHRASAREQDYRALYLYRMRGWQPWTCARKLGLREDGHARSKRVPTWAEAAYLGGGGPAPAPPGGTPPWPGKVYAYGDCDHELRTWQLRMNRFGYDFQGTGCYYAETRAAVLALQRANGIKTSGLLGPKTWRAAWHGQAPVG
ncbi:transglycosylase family protein [Actinophytocola sp.]|uniref:transglycosylase family protein n=1 Tax=Actinophytocola sp. TaxID=1872138 RepID=UPI003D6C163A